MPKYLTRQSKCICIVRDGDETYEGDLGFSGIGGPTYKLDVGAQCNLLLEMADDYDEMPDNASKLKSDALRAIVARVAEFESLESEPI